MNIIYKYHVHKWLTLFVGFSGGSLRAVAPALGTPRHLPLQVVGEAAISAVEGFSGQKHIEKHIEDGAPKIAFSRFING